MDSGVSHRTRPGRFGRFSSDSGSFCMRSKH